MKRYLVLGGYGIIGKAVVNDLFKFAKNDEIIIAGRDGARAEEYAKSFNSKRVKYQKIDISNKKEFVKILKNKDMCVNCLQYSFNLIVMDACINAKVNYVDLGGMFHTTKKQLELCKKFVEIGKCAVLGIGGAPGLSNILAAYGGSKLNKLTSIEIVFADVDHTRYDKKFILPYSFKTLIEEFTSKPAVFRNGKTIFVKPKSGTKEYYFGREFGKQKGFLTLHSEIATLPSYFRKKGIKNCEFRVTFPDSFVQTIQSLIDLGFSSNKNVFFKDKNIKIMDATTKIMDKLVPSREIKINDSEIIRVIIDNKIIDALTKSDGKSSAGVLGTAIPCSIAAQMITEEKICKSGVFAPEEAFNYNSFFKELRKRNIKVYENQEAIN